MRGGRQVLSIGYIPFPRTGTVMRQIVEAGGLAIFGAYHSPQPYQTTYCLCTVQIPEPGAVIIIKEKLMFPSYFVLSALIALKARLLFNRMTVQNRTACSIRLHVMWA